MTQEFSTAEIGERLRVARSNARITQERAADAIGVARTTIVAMENGTRKVRPEELIKLADLFGLTVNSLLRRQRPELNLVAQFRRSETTRRDDGKSGEVTSLLQHLAEGYIELEQILSAPLNPAYPPEVKLRRGRIQEQADDVALELRARLGIGLAPISNVIGLLEDELKIRIFERRLPSGVAGAFAYQSAVGACVVVNALQPRARRSWAAVHECGHFLAHRDEMDIVFTDEAERARDRFADLFAASFLLPAAGVRSRFDHIVTDEGRFSPRSLILLARAFGVSLEAMGRRLENLMLLPRGTYESLRERGLSQKTVEDVLGAVIEEDGPVPASQRMALLASEAHGKGLLSEGQVSSLLRLDRLTVRRLLDALPGEDDMGEEDA